MSTSVCPACRQHVFVRMVISGTYLGHHYIQRGLSRFRCDASGQRVES